jgi:hypothetical protein
VPVQAFDLAQRRDAYLLAERRHALPRNALFLYRRNHAVGAPSGEGDAHTLAVVA